MGAAIPFDAAFYFKDPAKMKKIFLLLIWGFCLLISPDIVMAQSANPVLVKDR